MDRSSDGSTDGRSGVPDGSADARSGAPGRTSAHAGDPTGAQAGARTGEWTRRWYQLARSAGVEPGAPLLLALSGGADSVLLLHLLAAATPRPDFRAVHVDHNLRGAESRGDAEFCGRLCRALGVPFTRLAVELDPRASSLEARAREVRYRALIDEALGSGHRTIVTGHHSDDQVETLLMRWIRGTHLPGLVGLRPRIELDATRAFGGSELAPPSADAADAAVWLVRPLLSLRRAEVRRLLSDRGLTWREDTSNLDPRFTRNRVRHGLIPTLRRVAGDDAVENLHAFGRAVEKLEDQLAGATAHLAWKPSRWWSASRGPADIDLGGMLPRAELMRLAPTLRRRVLWRLVVEGIGRAPSKALLESVLTDLGAGRCRRHTLPSGWSLILRSREVHLVPPSQRSAATGSAAAARARARDTQATLPFPEPDDAPAAIDVAELDVPGITTLPDGRRVSAEVREGPPAAGPRSLVAAELEVQLDAERVADRLTIRTPRPGDRFHALGAPGSKPLRRFLADCGIPREERDRVLLVLAGSEIVWVVGVRPSESCRVRATTRRRVVLSLHHSGSGHHGGAGASDASLAGPTRFVDGA